MFFVIYCLLSFRKCESSIIGHLFLYKMSMETVDPYQKVIDICFCPKCSLRHLVQAKNILE